MLAPTANAAGTGTGEIGDYVWKDLNQNGIQDPGEPGIPGVTVTLTDVFGDPSTTTTDANGLYHFSNIGPGTYTVTVATPGGLLPSPSLVGGDRTVDSNGSGTIVTVPVAVYVDNTIDFGFYPTGSIGNFVWKDSNQNGIQDPGEPGIDGVTVKLTDAATGNVLATAVTANNGAYLFTGLAAGNYKVVVDTSSPALAGFVPTFAQASGSTAANDSDASPLTVVLPTDSSVDPNADFGFIPTPPGTIGDFIWFDRNHNGIQDAPGTPDFEPGIPGVTVQLINLDLPGNPVIATQTDPDGYYFFHGLLPGRYRVVVDNSQPALAGAGYLPTTVTSPPDPAAANDSNVNPWDVTLVLTPPPPSGGVSMTSSDTTVDFGYYRLASLAGFVYVDANNDGVFQATEVALPGVTVTLTGTDIHGAAVTLTTTTNANGRYLFANLEPSDAEGYTIIEIQPDGYLDGKDTIGTPGGTTSNDVFSAVVLGYGVAGENNNFGELPPSSLAGTVFLDSNNNGVQDGTEPGLAGVKVTLTGTDDQSAVNRPTTTDANGHYSFTRLRPGTYVITETQPAIYQDGKDTIGTPGGTTSNDVFSGIVLNSGFNGVNNNFGEQQQQAPTLASLSGYVYADANNNGLKEAGELPISGVTVTVTGTDITGAAVNATTTTDATGLYSFKLVPSNAAGYRIAETQPGGYLDGKDTIGTPGGTTANDVFTSVVLNSGVNGVNNNFGELVATNPLGAGDTATIGFWHNKNGQALINAVNGGGTSTAFANWLAASYPYLYGVNAGANNLTGKSNKDVAALFMTFFNVKGTKTDAQVMAGAIAAYVTNSTLAGGTYAAGYGFNVTSSGTGAKTYNVGSLGTSIGLLNNTAYTLSQLLQQANLMKQQGTFNAGSFNTIFDAINVKGDII